MDKVTDIAINKSYEIDDHIFRNADQYALGKYDMTIRWLAQEPAERGRTLLNVGCGGGLFNNLAADNGYKVTGVEPDKAAFDLALETAKGKDIRVLLGDISRVDGEQFDVIVMHDVLEHIQNDSATLDILKKLVKPNGLLIISVPALQALFGIHDEHLGHFRRYSKGQLVRLVKMGFKVEKARYYGFAFIPIVYVLSVLLRRPYPVGTASQGLVAKIMRAICQLETRISLPIGTSVILKARNN